MANYSVQGADGQMYGPVNDAGLLNWATQGRVDRSSNVRVEETGATYQAAVLPVLAGHFSAAPQPVQAASISRSLFPRFDLFDPLAPLRGATH